MQESFFSIKKFLKKLPWRTNLFCYIAFPPLFPGFGFDKNFVFDWESSKFQSTPWKSCWINELKTATKLFTVYQGVTARTALSWRKHTDDIFSTVCILLLTFTLLQQRCDDSFILYRVERTGGVHHPPTDSQLFHATHGYTQLEPGEQAGWWPNC